MKNTLLSFFGLVLLFYTNSTFSQNTFYVDASNAGGINDGTSWETAFLNLTSAIYSTDIEVGDTILVAKGTYLPPESQAYYINVPELKIFGGFPSGGGTFADRNWEQDSTILLGNGNSVLYLDNTMQVVVNGFFITGGVSPWGGGGIYNNNPGSSFKNLVIYDNVASYGGGMQIAMDNTTLENIVFKNNIANCSTCYGVGGGLVNYAGNNISLTNIVFENNIASGVQGSSGGGFHNSGNNVILKNVEFIGNSAKAEVEGITNVDGGGLSNNGDNMVLKQVVFEGNTAIAEDNVNAYASGGGMNNNGINLIILDSQFTNNIVSNANNSSSGGAINVYNNNSLSKIQIVNSRFEGNSSNGNTYTNGGAVNINGARLLIVKSVDFIDNLSQGQTGASAGAVRCDADSVYMENINFENNIVYSISGSSTAGAFVYDSDTQNSIIYGQNIRFSNNKAICENGNAGGGALRTGNMGRYYFENTIFYKNYVKGFEGLNAGGAIFDNGGFGTLNNCLFIENEVFSEENANSYAGAIIKASSSLKITNSTFVKNKTSTENGTALAATIANASTVEIKNCVFWENEVNEEIDDIFNLGTLVISNSFTQTDFTEQGTGNILGSESPFVNLDNPEGADGILGTPDDGIALACGSPAIDAGDDSALDSDSNEDITGLPRYNNTIDMGAYEYHGIVTSTETAEFCPVDGAYSWNNETYTEDGTYAHAVDTDENGCETLEILILDLEDGIEVDAVEMTPVCIHSTFTVIAYTTEKVNEVTSSSGLPEGVTAEYINNTIVFTGTPTEAGLFYYLLHLKGCGEKIIYGTIRVLSGGSASSLVENAELCLDTYFFDAIAETDNITQIISFDGFPEGISPYLESNKLWLDGTSSEAGDYNYTIELLGCENMIFNGTLSVIEDNEVTAINQTLIVCVDTPLENEISHHVAGLLSIDTVYSLPNGIEITLVDEDLIVSGTPTEAGTYEYAVIPGNGCTPILGSIQVTVPIEVFGATQTPTTCINSEMTNIIHFTEGVSQVGEILNLPEGIDVEVLEDAIRISGIPMEEGDFNYEITLLGACGEGVATGTITVLPEPTISEASSHPTSCIDEILGEITFTTIGVTGIIEAIGLPEGVSAVYEDDTIIISGIPTESGSFSYEIIASTACENITATGEINVTPNYVIEATSTEQEICVNNNIPVIVYTTAGVNAISSVSGLPSGLTATMNGDLILISGTPTEVGEFNFVIEVESDLCGNAVAEGTITVNELPNVDLGEDIMLCEGDEINIQLDAGDHVSITWNTGATTSVIEVTEAGVYSVTAIDENGCLATGSIEISTLSAPELSVEQIDYNIIEAFSGFVVSYQWINCETEEFIGNSTTNTFIAEENGEYAVIIVDQNGCTAISDCITISTIEVENEDFANLSVYPNPTFGTIYVDFGQNINNASLLIMDVTGKIIQKHEINNQSDINISLNAARGVYLLKMMDKTGIDKVVKIIKE